MSAMERAIAEEKLECTLYIKFKKGELAFTLRDLFKDAALTKMDSDIAVVLLQNVTMGAQFNLMPELVDEPNLDDEYRISVNPLMEKSIIMKYDGVLKNILTSVPDGANDPKLQKSIEHALVESDNLKKIEQVFVILVEVSVRGNLHH